MAQAFIGIGSNIDKHLHIANVLDEFRHDFDQLVVSPIYQTPALGFAGDDFYNLVVSVETELAPGQLYDYLRTLEKNHGRERNSDNQFVSRVLDLDLLLYDDLQIEDGKISIPHDDIINYAFVLKPLADIAGDQCHPQLKESYSELWRNFDKKIEHMKVVPENDLCNSEYPELIGSSNTN